MKALGAAVTGLQWTPEEFWRTTPRELWAIADASQRAVQERGSEVIDAI